MDIDESQIFNVSSSRENVVSGTTSDFIYKFDIDNDANYDRCAILSASIPKSYYLIDENNDDFILVENNIQVPINIPHGNYTITAWKQTLTSLLTSNSPNNWVYNVSFPNANQVNKGKLLFTVIGNDSQPQFIFDEQLYKQFGFYQGTYTFNNNQLESINVINLQLINTIYIKSDIVNNKHDDVLQVLYSNSSDFSNITFQATELLANSKPLATKNNFMNKFYLTDNNHQRINLNGLEFNFTIIFFKKNNTLQMIKDFIKLNLLRE